MPSRIDRNTPPPPVRPATVARPAGSPATVPADRFEPAANGGIQTVFTPGDEAKRLELAALDEVIAARRADGRQYTPADNPYVIEYAIYNMTDRDVIGRLLQASRAGVRVQVLIDADQIGPHKPHNTVVNDLVAGGFTHAESQHSLSAEERRDTQVIEIDMPGNGLFHFKSRYFTYPDPVTGARREVLLTGSHNPQTSAQKNDESLHKITDPRIVSRYTEAYRALRDDGKIVNQWEDQAGVNVLFSSASTTGPKPVDKIFELVDQENELIFLTVFALRNLVATHGAKLVDRLAAAHQRGVPVVVVTDRKSADGVELDGLHRPGANDDPTDELIASAGIPIYEYINPSGPRTAMHLKSALFGLSEMKVVTDTGNWTAATMGKGGSRGANAESLLFVNSARYDGNATGVRYLAEFCRVLRRYADQNIGTDRKDVEALIAELQAKPGWPKVEVDLEILARTAPGQELYLTGDHPLLEPSGGAPGLRLQEDPTEALFHRPGKIELPLATRLEYQLVKRDAQGRLEYEPQGPALLIVDPTGAPEASTTALRHSDRFGEDT